MTPPHWISQRTLPSHQCALLWGPSLVLLYNDLYVDMVGMKHPRIFGQQDSEGLGELWEQLGPLSQVVLGCEAVGRWDSEHDSLDIVRFH